jgi:isochorismate synthase
MTPTSETHISVKAIQMESFWHTAISEGLPVAIWRLPKSTDKQLLIDLSGRISHTKIDLEELPSGFAMSPFIGESLFLKGDLYFQFDTQNQIIDEFQNQSDEAQEFARKVQLFYDKQEDLDFSTKPAEQPEVKPKKSFEHPTETSLYNEMTYAEMVSGAIDAIQRGDMQKVVLSRTKQITLPADFEVIDAFNKLCVAYPNAFVSLVYLPQEKALWLGATPETLISMDKNGIFRTMSLAGTQSAIGHNGEKYHPAEIRWSCKEIEEQAFVSRYIIECFKKIRLREYIEIGPKTVQAGNLMHLRTDYTVDTNEVNFPQLGTVMTELLHPTSAVCGTPKEPALRFIAENELHSREYYSGFLGPVNIQNESHLFVNLRTMKIVGNQATLFAGGGITEDSNPVKEWYETEMKSQTLLRVIL